MSPSKPRPLTREQIHAALWEVAAKQSGKDPGQLDPRARLIQDLGTDSLGMAELGMDLEEKLGIDIPDDVLDQPELTLGQVEEAIWTRCRGEGGAG